MALSPGHVPGSRRVPRDQMLRDCDVQEQHLDAQLERLSNPTYPVRLNLPPQATTAHVTELKKRYTKAGWSVGTERAGGHPILRLSLAGAKATKSSAEKAAPARGTPALSGGTRRPPPPGRGRPDSRAG